MWAAIAALLVAGSAIAWRAWPRATPVGPAVGGQLSRIVYSERQALEPALSPDGLMLAYVAEDQNEVFDIFVSRVAGGDRVRITNDAARESHPRFSADGNQVVFARRRPNERDPEICVVPSLGGQVSVVVANASQPVWSPDGGRLAFIRPATASTPFVLATARLDGSDERTLVQADGVYPAMRNPAWSPDGNSIVFVRSTGGIAAELWSVPASGGALRRISNDPPTVFVDEPVFSEDGRAIIHSSNRGGATNIWSMRVDGTDPVRLTTGSGPDEAPSIDRTGRVAFINAHWRSELFVRRLSTGETRVTGARRQLPLGSGDIARRERHRGEPGRSRWLVASLGRQPRRRRDAAIDIRGTRRGLLAVDPRRPLCSVSELGIAASRVPCPSSGRTRGRAHAARDRCRLCRHVPRRPVSRVHDSRGR